MMNRWWSISGLVLNILAIFVAAWLVMTGLGWVRVGHGPAFPSVGVGVAYFGLLVVLFVFWWVRKRS
jgi:divalent metal cation (Fe/Co/Zn/Cd) transporter